MNYTPQNNVKVCDGKDLFQTGAHKPDNVAVLGCQKVCVPLAVPFHPTASEWYCPGCDTSYAMSQEETKAYGKRQRQ